MRLESGTRAALIADVRGRLQVDGSPRLTMLMIVSMAGTAAFLVSVGTLWLGVRSMPVRYAIAALTGYAAFALLMWVWIGWKRRSAGTLVDAADPLPPFDLVSVSGSRGGGGGSSAVPIFGGGQSGGGGAAAQWQPGAPEPQAPVVLSLTGSQAKADSGGGSGSRASLLDGLDADEKIWPVILAVALAASALIAVGFVVFSAPSLLAEVAIDAGLMSGVYRRLRKHESGHWMGAVWRRTWLPGLVVVVFSAGIGYALQRIAPEAQSIGGVIRALTG
jgi:hypothetical protein